MAVFNSSNYLHQQYGDWISVGRILSGGQLGFNPFGTFTNYSSQSVGTEIASSDEKLKILVTDGWSNSIMSYPGAEDYSAGAEDYSDSDVIFSYKLNILDDDSSNYTYGDMKNGVGLLLSPEAVLTFDYLQGGSAQFYVLNGDIVGSDGKVDINTTLKDFSPAIQSYTIQASGFYSNDGALTITNSGDADFDKIIQATMGSDVFIGTKGNDQIFASDGDDFIFDWKGNDSVDAGAGNDIMRAGRGKDNYDGGDGIDTFFVDYAGYEGDFTTVSMDLDSGTIVAENSSSGETIQNTENIHLINSDLNFNLTGDAYQNILISSDGNDTLSGGGGIDALYGGDGNDRFFSSTGDEGARQGDFYLGGKGEDALVYESIYENGANQIGAIVFDARTQVSASFNNGAQNFNLNNLNSLKAFDTSGNLYHEAYVADMEVIVGTSGDDQFFGSDNIHLSEYIQLNGLGLNDESYEAFAPDLGDDIVDGGLGYDEVNYAWNSGSNRSVNIDLSAGTAILTQDGASFNDTITNIEGVEGSNGADIIKGNDDANALDGRGGNDQIDGSGGFDFVEYNGNFSEKVVVNLQTGVAKDGRGGTDTLSNIEGAIGSHGHDIFIGKDGVENIFYGQNGFDILNLEGSQTDYVISDHVDAATGKSGYKIEKFNENVFDEIIDTDFIYNIEGVNYSVSGLDVLGRTNASETTLLEEGDDYFIGSASADAVYSLGGEDEVYSGGGNDTIILDGNFDPDTFIHLGSGDDELVLTKNVEGEIAARAGAGNDTLVLEQEVDRLALVGDDLKLIFKTLDTELTLENQFVNANDPDDEHAPLVGNEGYLEKSNNAFEVVVSETGDHYVFDKNDYQTGNYLFISGSNSSNKIETQGNYEEIYQYAIYGFDGNDKIEGGLLDDKIRGGSGNDDLYGRAGSDYLDGGAGDDLLDGASGKDYLTGGSGNDGFAIEYHLGAFLEQDNKFEIDLSATDNIDMISDVSGDRDFIAIDVRGNESPLTAVNPFGLPTDIEIINGNLRFSSEVDADTWWGFNSTDGGEGHTPYVYTESLDGWYWRDDAVPEIDGSSEADTTLGMTLEEANRFSLADPSTYPGWNDLNASEQKFFSDLLVRQDTGQLSDDFLVITQSIENHYASNGYSYDGGQGASLNIVDGAVSAGTNLPYFPFIKALAENVAATHEIDGFKTGFEIENFVSSSDTIETLIVIEDAVGNSEFDNLIDEFGWQSMDDYDIQQLKDEGVARGLAKEYHFDQTGLVESSEDIDFILVANHESSNLDGMEAMWFSIDETGKLTFEIERPNYDDPNYNWNTNDQNNGMVNIRYGPSDGSIMEIGSQGYSAISLSEGDDAVVVGGIGDDILYGSSLEDQIRDVLFGGEGADKFYAGGEENFLIGGDGSDIFVVDGGYNISTIVGDSLSLSGDAYNPGTLSTQNTNYSDSVYLEWSRDEVTLSNPKEGYFRIEHGETGSVVDLYDVENLYFSNGDGGYDYKPLTQGQIVGQAQWQGAAEGLEIEYDTHNVSFQVKGDTLKVLASATVTVTEEQFVTNKVFSLGGVEYSSMTYPTITEAQWTSYGASLAREEQVSIGVQTYDKVLQDAVIWEGNRTEVDAFEFADGVSVNVINVSSTDLADNPVFDTIGTEGIDLIFGDDQDNLIDGKGGDDIIFGGAGDDVIIGGEGDDVLLGGDGSDTIRGDMLSHDDAAIGLWQAGAGSFNDTRQAEADALLVEDFASTAEYQAEYDKIMDQQITFDDSNLSLENYSDESAGNDMILGGNQLDDIKSGGGDNFVSSGKADLQGNGVDQADLDLINENIEHHNKLIEDDEWM